jgi:hypothetical protein
MSGQGPPSEHDQLAHLVAVEIPALEAERDMLAALLAEWIAPGTVYEIRRNGQILDLHASTRAALSARRA